MTHPLINNAHDQTNTSYQHVCHCYIVMEFKKYLLCLGAWHAFAVVKIYGRKEWSMRMFLKAQNNEIAKPDELK